MLFPTVKGKLGYYQAFRRSKDPVSLMVLYEDSAALIGILIAAIGTFAATSLNGPMFDGIASIFIGLVLASTAILLARESKSLLIGERAERKLIDSVHRIANKASMVSRTNEVLMVHLAPDQILAALSLEFSNDLRTPQIDEIVINIEREIRAAHPEIVAIFVTKNHRASHHGYLIASNSNGPACVRADIYSFLRSLQALSCLYV